MTPKTRKDGRQPEPRKRFRIEKLEERIAPAKGGNRTKNCPGVTDSGASSSPTSSPSATTVF